MSPRLAVEWVNLLIPDWPAPASVRAACSTRWGGVSVAPFDSLNLGDHVGDAPAAVVHNRQRFAATLGVRPVFLQQVHGFSVAALNHLSPDGLPADGCVTALPGLACTVMVADCLPVLLCRADGRLVAAAHAGWRGLAGGDGRGVLESVIGQFKTQARLLYGRSAIKKEVNFMREGAASEEAESANAAILAWLGPCIGPSAFEVGPEVREAFVNHDAGSEACFAPSARGSTSVKFLADLAGLARRRLARLGVTRLYGNDSTQAWCTASNPSQFFSHRRDGWQVRADAGVGVGGTGRFAASIWRVGGGD